MGLKDWIKNQNDTFQAEQWRSRQKAELDAVEPHPLRGSNESALSLYFITSLILRGVVTPCFPDERQSALAVSKLARSLGIDEETQRNLQQEASRYDDDAQQRILGDFVANAPRDVVVFLFCDFARLHGEKYSFEGEVLEVFRGLAGGVFHLPPSEIASLELLCKKIASGEEGRVGEKFCGISEALLEYYLGKEKEMGTYLVIDLSGGPDAGGYPVRYTETAPNLALDTCRTTELWLRRIPKVTFIMGSPASELERMEDEAQHQVTLTRDFYIGVFPVTQRQWKLVMGGNPSQFRDSGPGAPVEYVSYDDICGENRPWPADAFVSCDSFLGRIREKTGLRSLDLPTEAQWEYACRAGTSTALSFGNVCNGAQCNCKGIMPYGMGTVGPYLKCTCKVGSYLPNPWGLYDMHGNVWEWCADLYDDYSGNATDPKGATSGSRRVLRGGSWNNLAQICRSAFRSNDYPSSSGSYYPSSGNGSYGFRVALLP